MLQLRKTILLSGFIVFLLAGHLACAKTLEQKLYEVDRLRAGFDTPFDEVEKKCNELLKEYTKPEEQAKIYFELVQVEGQSGFQRPDKILGYITKALECPQEPLKKVRLYTYWGGAIQVANRGVRNQALVVARRKALMPYLQGLKETLKYNLPEVKPDIPLAGFFTHDGPTDSEHYRKLKRKNEEQAAAQKLAMFQRDMIQHRNVLTGQISSMYSRFPWASDKIRELATKILEDETAVERLMSHVDEAVQKRVKELGWEPGPPDISLPATVTQQYLSKLKGVFIPVADKALKQGKPFVFDLKNAILLNPAAKIGSAQAHENLLKLGKGDIAWDGSLVTVRKAKALTVSQESHRPLKCTLGRWCNWNRLPDKVDLPYSVLVVTKEDVDYLITIRKIESDGIRIIYKKLNPDEVKSYLPARKKM